jgi:hypothetical protein
MKEIFMSTFIRSTLIAIAILGGVSAASARTDPSDANGRTPSSYNLNNSDDVKRFWDAQQRHGE